ncbi:hypothetical protein [Rhizobium sp. P007]|uniref:hypothetical protein n=1 Tax=Rhizobium sp. P007 TaxID=285908 RepID=UPI001157799A|nr:hypothetical protein [Rhizobium sp. P007]
MTTMKPMKTIKMYSNAITKFFTWILDAITTPGPVTAGIAGAVVHTLLTPNKPFKESIVGLVAGILVAIFISPIAVDSLGWEQGSPISNAIPFIVGLCGRQLAESTLRFVTNWLNDPTLTVPSTVAAFLEIFISRNKKNDRNDNKPE